MIARGSTRSEPRPGACCEAFGWNWRNPLFLLLVLQSVARLCAWTRMLWGIARLDLRLVAPHADHFGGLGFVMTSPARSPFSSGNCGV